MEGRGGFSGRDEEALGLTKNGQIYYLEIISEMFGGISALTIKGPGNVARFELEGYKVKPPQK